MLNKIKQFFTGAKRANVLAIRLQTMEAAVGRLTAESCERGANFERMRILNVSLNEECKRLTSANNRLTDLLGKKQAKAKG